jgi:hypothetical protein
MKAELMVTLSAPLWSRRSTSSVDRTPPPAANGMKQTSARSRRRGTFGGRPWRGASMSSAISSSTPRAL